MGSGTTTGRAICDGRPERRTWQTFRFIKNKLSAWGRCIIGKKKTKTEQINKPIYADEIGGAANAQQAAYNQAQPAIGQFSDNAGGSSNDLFAQFRAGDPTVQAAQGFLQGQLTGDPTQNPYLDQMVAQTNDSVRNQVQARMATRGQTGGSDYTGLIARALAENETGLRYGDYDRAMQRRMSAAGLTPGVTAAQYLPLEAAMNTGQAGAMLPLQAALANSAGVAGLLGQYQDVKGKTVQSGGLLGQILSGAAQGALSGGIKFCDMRLKENIEWIGKTPGGVPLYRFDYIGGERGVIGPMAQEVAVLQPGALGPEIDGFMTVDMGALQ